MSTCHANAPGKSKFPLSHIQLGYEGVSDSEERAAGPKKRLNPRGGALG